MNFFISDLHFGHENCLDFDNRPFKTIEEHDNALIERWNNAVGYDDDVYLLGDVAFGASSSKVAEYVSMLNGNKHLIIGNHDGRYLKNNDFRKHFVEITHYKELFIDKRHSIVLSHYPHLSYRNLFRGWTHLYGHVHASFDWNMMERNKRLMKELYSKEKDRLPDDVFDAYNVGAMLPYMNYTPRTLDEIRDGAKEYFNFNSDGKGTK